MQQEDKHPHTTTLLQEQHTLALRRKQCLLALTQQSTAQQMAVWTQSRRGVQACGCVRRKGGRQGLLSKSGHWTHQAQRHDTQQTSMTQQMTHM
jgi:hypothetical protein